MSAADRMIEIIGISPVQDKVSFVCSDSCECGSYERKYIKYEINGRTIPAFLLLPKGTGPFPAVLINHQHNSERNLGKSEVCGISGNPLQAFGPTLAEKGWVVIAPDSICFEERRVSSGGIEKNEDQDFLHHIFALCYGVLSGETLAKIVIEDAMGAVSVLNNLDIVDKLKIGCMGHSYGGNTTYFLTAFDKRLSFALSSGSVASYKHRIENNTGIEFASVIPGFIREYEIADVIKEIAPRRFMIVCADSDKYSKDAPDVYSIAKEKYISSGAEHNLQIKQFIGGHPLTEERFDFIINWITQQVI